MSVGLKPFEPEPRTEQTGDIDYYAVLGVSIYVSSVLSLLIRVG